MFRKFHFVAQNIATQNAEVAVTARFLMFDTNTSKTILSCQLTVSEDAMHQVTSETAQDAGTVQS